MLDAFLECLSVMRSAGGVGAAKAVNCTVDSPATAYPLCALKAMASIIPCPCLASPARGRGRGSCLRILECPQEDGHGNGVEDHSAKLELERDLNV